MSNVFLSGGVRKSVIETCETFSLHLNVTFRVDVIESRQPSDPGHVSLGFALSSGSDDL